MKTRHLTLALMALLAAGCAKELPNGNETLPTGKNTIVVNMPEMTKTALGEATETGVAVVWSAGDEIAVIEGKGTAEKFYSEYTLKELYDEMDKYDFDFLENNFQEIKKKFKKKGLM